MKQRHALLLLITLLGALCVGGGVWLHVRQRQYACNRQLIAALIRDDTPAALALVNAGANPNTRSAAPPAPTIQFLLSALLHRSPPTPDDSSTAFQLACGMLVEQYQGLDTDFTPAHEDAGLVQAMLAHGANVNASEPDNATPLHLAAHAGRLRTVELLLRHGANVNAQNFGGCTPLMLASVTDTPDTTRLLLKHGANVNMQDTIGYTPLMYVVAYGASTGIVSELLAHGADPNLRTKNGETPLTRAQSRKSTDVVALLRGRR